MKKNIKKFALWAMVIAFVVPAGVRADEMAESLVFFRNVAVNSKKLVSPAIFGISSARTMGACNGFIAGAGATSPRSARGNEPLFDGSAAVGLGLGNPRENIGFDTYLGIISVNPKGANGGFGVGEDGNLSFKAGHTFLTDDYDNISLAAGVNSLVTWGAAKRMSENVYGVVSIGSAFELGDTVVPVSMSFGAGSRQKHSRDFGVFAGLGLGITDIVDASVGYNASRWIMGLNLKFSQLSNSPILNRFVVQLGVDDVFNNDKNRRGVFVVAMPFYF